MRALSAIDRAAAPLFDAAHRLQATLGRRGIRTLSVALQAGFVVALVVFAVDRPVEAGDAHAYWAVDLAAPYSRPIATQDAFTYPPPAAIVFWVLGHLPWPVFEALWTIVIGVALLWMAGPWSLFLLALLPVSSDLYLGNIHILMAAAIVGGFRRPWLWSFPLLTKPSVGVGLLWFVLRREWRPLAIAIGATAALSLAALILQPALWPAWIDYLLRTGVSPTIGPLASWIPIPLLLRLPASVLLVAWGALTSRGTTNRAWTVPIAGMLALPVLWTVGLSMLIGVLALLRRPDLVPAAPGAEAGQDTNRTPAPRTPAFDAPDRSVEVAPDQPV
ncbi:MAG TPA: glycosyltransferase 87 family protein [Candidatus Limnocylindrales bacterium]